MNHVRSSTMLRAHSRARISFCDVAAVNAPYSSEIAAVLARVVVSGRLVLGPEVEAFEREAASYLGAGCAVGVACGTDALILSLLAAGVGPGDEVIVPAFGIFVDAEAVLWTGALPVLVNAHPDGRPRADEIEPATSDRTRAIVVPSLYGSAASIAELQAVADRLGLALIEDACQAFGSREGGRAVGTRGTVGCFSFYPTKVLGGLGDGGLLVSDDSALADRARLLRSHGAPSADKYRHAMLGRNSRLDELQAAVLRVKLRGLDTELARRRDLAALYVARLRDHRWLTLPEIAPGHTYYAFSVWCDTPQRRDALQSWLAADGIEAPVHFPVPIHRQPVLATRMKVAEGQFQASERLASTVLSLPCHPALSEQDIEHVCDSIARFAKERL